MSVAVDSIHLHIKNIRLHIKAIKHNIKNIELKIEQTKTEIEKSKNQTLLWVFGMFSGFSAFFLAILAKGFHWW